MGILTKDDQAKAIDMVKNGSTYTNASREIGAPLETVRRYCIKAGVRSSFVHTRKTESEIVAAIKDVKVITQTELSQLLGYQSMDTRLRGMIMRGKVKFIMLPASSSAAKLRWPLAKYQNRKLYYIDDKDLTEWLVERLPKHMPIGMRRVVTMKLNSIGISIPELRYCPKKYNSVALSDEVYKRLKTESKKRNVSLRIFTETLVRESLDSIEKIKA